MASRVHQVLRFCLAFACASLAQLPANAQATDLEKKVDTLSTGLGGFKLSGDFRFRADVQSRTGNAVAGPLQNVRSRYRVRLNADKDIDPKFRFHFQLSTGPYNVQTTNDQEFGAMAVKQPFSIAEGYLDYHPNSKIDLRGGRVASARSLRAEDWQRAVQCAHVGAPG